MSDNVTPFRPKPSMYDQLREVDNALQDGYCLARVVAKTIEGCESEDCSVALHVLDDAITSLRTAASLLDAASIEAAHAAGAATRTNVVTQEAQS